MTWTESKILVNQRRVSTMMFPGGEVNVRIPVSEALSRELRIYVDAPILNSYDLMATALTVDACHRAYESPVYLTIPYLPYARQDRVMNEGEALSIAVVAKIINALNCKGVRIFDPHSAVSEALIDRLRVDRIESFISKIIDEAKPDVFVSPDAGAEKKVLAAGEHFGIPVVCASKVRDIKSGALVGTRVYGAVEGKRCLIVDDICDGGATFVGLAEALIRNGASDVQLYVTHGIFSRGLNVFCGLLSAVHFTNSRGVFYPDFRFDHVITSRIQGVKE